MIFHKIPEQRHTRAVDLHGRLVFAPLDSSSAKKYHIDTKMVSRLSS